jgi:arginase family enzyme
MQDLRHFFSPIHFFETQDINAYHSGQLGYDTLYATEHYENWEEAEIVIVGCGECRGENEQAEYSQAPDAIRKQFYELYNWHPDLKIADAGNIIEGATLGDTRAALRTVLKELKEQGKLVIVLGGSHDLTLQQYDAFKKQGTIINATVADMLIDLKDEELITNKSFLMDMLTGEPNYIKHYSHIGFQSYYVHPQVLETLDKLRFDFFRLGKVRENMEEMEPVLRNTDLFSLDMNVLRFGDAYANYNGSPNGFSGEEACMLTRFAGMSSTLSSLGIYGYDPRKDHRNMTAKQIAQMLWYFIDGYQLRKKEASLADADDFHSFHLNFAGHDSVFMKSKRTGRWWMKMPNHSFIPCSYNDYLTACKDEMPERWLREQERLV